MLGVIELVAGDGVGAFFEGELHLCVEELEAFGDGEGRVFFLDDLFEEFLE